MPDPGRSDGVEDARAALAAQAPTRHVAADGVRLLVHRAEPSGPARHRPVLLLHGVPETAVCWRHLLPLLRDRVVLAPDLPGLGESEARGPYDPSTVARRLAALVVHEVGDGPGSGPVDVVGHDWGGTVAIALAQLRPDLVGRLVVIAASYRELNLFRAVHVPLFAVPLVPELVLRLTGGRVAGLMLDVGWQAAASLEPSVRAHYLASYAPPLRVDAMLGYYRDTTRPRLQRAVATTLPTWLRLPSRGSTPAEHVGTGRAGAGPPAAADAVTASAATPVEGTPTGGSIAARGDGVAADHDLPADRAAVGTAEHAGSRVSPGAAGDVGASDGRPGRGPLVVWGGRDPVLPASLGAGVARDLGAGAAFVTVPGTGHFPHEERPDVTGALIAEFLS